MEIFDNALLISALQTVWDFIKTTWWFFIFFILLPIFNSLWLFWRQELFKNASEWVLLELKMPREIKKGIKAMEQVLTALHSLRNAPSDFKERYMDGEVTRPFSLEMVSIGGEIRFFIRAYARYRGLVEAAFFSYYPDVEVVEVDDYVGQLPLNLQEIEERKLDLWGGEMVLVREDAYPIKTYRKFESSAEEKEFDPMSTFLEILGKIKKGEFVGIQILIAPKAPDWAEKYKGLVSKLKESSSKSAPSISSSSANITDYTKAMRTPGESLVLEEVENNLSKPAFDTLIRFIYLAPKETFFDSFARRGIIGAFNQYATLNLNAFRLNFNASTMVKIWVWPHIFPKKRNKYRKQRILYNYRRREAPPETFMGRLITSHFFNWNFASTRFAMNTECLATLFHLPTRFVLTAPHLKQVESRKAGPPAGLAIFGEEEEIKKFQ